MPQSRGKSTTDSYLSNTLCTKCRRIFAAVLAWRLDNHHRAFVTYHWGGTGLVEAAAREECRICNVLLDRMKHLLQSSRSSGMFDEMNGPQHSWTVPASNLTSTHMLIISMLHDPWYHYYIQFALLHKNDQSIRFQPSIRLFPTDRTFISFSHYIYSVRW